MLCSLDLSVVCFYGWGHLSVWHCHGMKKLDKTVLHTAGSDVKPGFKYIPQYFFVW